jgi:hypothetical protein
VSNPELGKRPVRSAGANPERSIASEKLAGSIVVSKFDGIKIAKYCCLVRDLHGEIVMRIPPACCFFGVTVGADFTADKFCHRRGALRQRGCFLILRRIACANKQGAADNGGARTFL